MFNEARAQSSVPPHRSKCWDHDVNRRSSSPSSSLSWPPSEPGPRSATSWSTPPPPASRKSIKKEVAYVVTKKAVEKDKR